MGRQKKTVRNKRKIGITDYENDIIDTKDTKKQISKTFSRELKITIVSIFVVTIVMISSAFAIFSSVQKSEKYNTLTVGTLKVDFIDTEDGMGNIINLNGAYPISDAKGQEEDPYSFKITNSGTLAASYKIKILDDTDMINEDNCQDNLLDKSKIRVSINKGEAFTLSDTEANEFTVEQGTLEASDVKNYEIRIWIKEDSGNEVLGKHYHGKIVVEGVNAKSTTKLCKRATKLHKETCNSSICQADGYAADSEVEYGLLGTEGTLTSGDAFDCDINGDGVYDDATERFYYVSDYYNTTTKAFEDDTAVLVYYNNVKSGVSDSYAPSAYDIVNKSNWYGPVTAVEQLPNTSQWETTLKGSERAIINQNGENTTYGGTLPTDFSYVKYAARLLTYQEINSLCNTSSLTDNCKYLFENTKYAKNQNSLTAWWLENAHASNSSDAYIINSLGKSIATRYVTDTSAYVGVRPAIEVQKTNISY